MSENTLVKVPRCSYCKSFGDQDRFGNTPQASRVVPIYKTGTTQISKWSFVCERHAQDILNQERTRHPQGEAPPSYKLSLVVDGMAKRGSFHIDGVGGTRPSTHLTWEERNRANATGGAEAAQTAKRKRLLTAAEYALWERRARFSEALRSCDGSVEAEITAFTPPEGIVYSRCDDYVSEVSQERVDEFQNKVYAMLEGYEARLKIEGDADAGDADAGDDINIVFDLIALPNATPEEFCTVVKNYGVKYAALLRDLESSDDDDDDEVESCDCIDCCPDNYCSNCEDLLDDCDCEE